MKKNIIEMPIRYNSDEYQAQLGDLNAALSQMSINLVTQAVNLAMVGAWSLINRQMEDGDTIPLCLEELADCGDWRVSQIVEIVVMIEDLVDVD